MATTKVWIIFILKGKRGNPSSKERSICKPPPTLTSSSTAPWVLHKQFFFLSLFFFLHLWTCLLIFLSLIFSLCSLLMRLLLQEVKWGNKYHMSPVLNDHHSLTHSFYISHTSSISFSNNSINQNQFLLINWMRYCYYLLLYKFSKPEACAWLVSRPETKFKPSFLLLKFR